MDVSGSESDDYAPAAKKKAPARTKQTAVKAAAKPKAPAKKKVLVDKDDNADDAEGHSLEDEAISEARDGAPAATNGKKKTASEMYQKVCRAPYQHQGGADHLLAHAIGAHSQAA